MNEDKKKTGAFLKMLRREKGITQEQLAEFYGVSFAEILNGERKEKEQSKEEELRETLKKVVELTEEEKADIKKNTHKTFVIGLIAELVFLFLFYSGNALNGFGSSCSGVTLGALILGVIITNKSFEINLPNYRMRVRKKREL